MEQDSEDVLLTHILTKPTKGGKPVKTSRPSAYAYVC